MSDFSIKDERRKLLEEFENKIGYHFRDISQLDKALTHSSYRNHPDHVTEYRYINECLEFLGDSILDFVISEYLYNLYSDWDEGKLSKFRSKVVCEQSLVIVARKLELWKYMLVGKGEHTGKEMNPSMMADAVEAFIAGIYLDSGLEDAKKIIMSLLTENITAIIEKKILRDSKTELQEILQGVHASPVRYVEVSREGPPHDPTFVVEAMLDGKCIGSGKGKSKKEAEQTAAAAAIDRINESVG